MSVTDPTSKKQVGRGYILRFGVFAGVLLLLFAGVFAYMVKLSVKGDQLRKDASSRIIREVEIPARWGNIYSSDGYLLAATVLKYDVSWDATVVKDSIYKKNIGALCDSMARHFPNRDRSGWKRLFQSARDNKKQSQLILNQTSQGEKDLLRTFPILKLDQMKGGIIIRPYPKRINPLRGMGDRLIGFSDSLKGFTGVEGKYMSQIKGQSGSRMSQRIKGDWKPLNQGNKKDPVDGKDLVLTVDARMQNIVHKSLLSHLEKWQAERGCVVIMDVKTGAVKAMVNLGQLPSGTYAEIQNYAVGEKSDPGSTFKLMTVLAMLEENVVDTTQMIDTDGGIYTLFGKRVRDYKVGGYGVVSLHKAFVKSSNTAIVKTAYNNFKDRPEIFVNRLLKMQLGQKSGIDIAGEPDPYIPVPGTKGRWSAISLPWMSYGYELQLTPLQTLAFYNAVANDGVYLQPYLLQQVRENSEPISTTAPKATVKIATDKNIKIVQDLLRSTVDEKGGTAHGACYDPRLRIAGKTGTAQYNYGRGEPMQYMVSFAGYFPYEAPKYSFVVCIYKPQGYSVAGGSVAAPVMKDIALELYCQTPEEVFKFDGDTRKIDAYAKQQATPVKIDPKSTRMPSLKGLYPYDVVAKLEGLGLKVEVKGGIGKIISQSIAENSPIKKGDKLIITAN